MNMHVETLKWLLVGPDGELLLCSNELRDPALPRGSGAPFFGVEDGAGVVAGLILPVVAGEAPSLAGCTNPPDSSPRTEWFVADVSHAPADRTFLVRYCSLSPRMESGSSNFSTARFFDFPTGRFWMALSGDYLEVNRALAAMHGYENPDVLVRNRVEMNSLWSDPTALSAFLQRVIEDGSAGDVEMEIRREDGETAWVLLFGQLVRAPSGRPICVEGTAIDITKRMAEEAALRRSHDRFTRLMATQTVVPWEADVHMIRIEYVGPGAEHLLGFPAAEWRRPGFWLDQVHPEDRDWLRLVREEGLEKRDHFECEYRMVRADLKTVWVRDIVRAIPAEGGVRRLAGFLLEVTHRRSAEEALRETQHFIEQVANAAPALWYVFDVELRRIIYLNGGGIRDLGYTKDGLLNMQPFFLLALAHPSEESAHREHFEKLSGIPEDEIVEREFRIRAAHGNWIWLQSNEVVFKTDEDGNVRQIVGLAEDITFQRAAQQELAESEALFRRLAETTRVVPFEFELLQKRFLYVGPQAEDLLGYPLRRWYSLNFWETTVAPDDAVRVEAAFADAILGQKTDFECEFRMVNSEGKPIWIRQIVRLESRSENDYQGRGFLIDISAAKSLEAELAVSHRELRELSQRYDQDRERERVAVSREIHDELGQVLTLFRLDLSWIMRRLGAATDGSGDEQVMAKLQQMETQIETTLQIVRRITTRLRPPILDEFGLAEAIRWQASEFSRRASIRCDVHIEPVECHSRDTSTAVFRIFQEILTNVARHARARRVDIRLVQIGAGIKLTVSDNGCGFATDQVRGFGLLGMRERTEALGGTLELQSEPGQGTCVTLRVSCTPAPDVQLPA